jgi:cytochrome c553
MGNNMAGMVNMCKVGQVGQVGLRQWLLVWALMGASAVYAQDTALVARLEAARQNPVLRDQLVQQGRKAAAVCAYCHGDGGNSVKPDVPNLAAQNTAYLLELKTVLE